MKLCLVKAGPEYKEQVTDMLDEWYATGEKIVPYAIRKNDYHNFEQYCENIDAINPFAGYVPGSTFFCLDTDRNIMVGVVSIRHYLNELLLLHAGHIGDGVRPSERRKGIATAMIALALQECKNLGIDRVLMVCDKDNIGSAKSIINNGGIFSTTLRLHLKVTACRNLPHFAYSVTEGKNHNRYMLRLSGQIVPFCGIS